MLKSSLLRLDMLAQRYGGRPSAYADIADPAHAFWIDEAAHLIGLEEEAKRLPKPPSPIDQLFRTRR